MRLGIVIPTYWRKDNSSCALLRRSLTSILNQTYSKYHVFLIGDNYEVVDELLDISKIIPSEKISVINLPFAKERDIYTGHRLWCTGGVYASNIGINLCLSNNINYICHLDHDDWWEHTHLNEIAKAFNEKDYAIVATQSTHINSQILPKIKTHPFYPKCGDLIRSSVCINFKNIDLRYRNVFKETGVDFPADCDLWKRLSNYMVSNNLIGKLINKITCNHQDEGYSKKIK